MTMPVENHQQQQLQRWVSRFDDVTAAYLRCLEDVILSEYEADRAGAWLSQSVFIHCNAFSTLASAASAVAHAPSAWLIARATFESAVTAVWLCHDPDWKEREARYLGWVTDQEQHLAKVADDLARPPVGNSAAAAQLLDQSARARQLREAIAAKLPKDSRLKRPSLIKMLEEIGLDRRHYIRYRIGSIITHASPAAAEHFVTIRGNRMILRSELGFSTWIELFKLMSWSLASVSIAVLPRLSVPEAKVHNISNAHAVLLAALAGE